jgi:hypothetical protein
MGKEKIGYIAELLIEVINDGNVEISEDKHGEDYDYLYDEVSELLNKNGYVELNKNESFDSITATFKHVSDIITVRKTVQEVFDLDLWDKLCDRKGWNPWSVNEGLLRMEDEIEVDEDLL